MDRCIKILAVICGCIVCIAVFSKRHKERAENGRREFSEEDKKAILLIQELENIFDQVDQKYR